MPPFPPGLPRCARGPVSGRGGWEADGPMRVIDCAGPGITRRRAGKGFTYLDQDGNRVEDPAVVDRIRALAIPPAWTDVRICPTPRPHPGHRHRRPGPAPVPLPRRVAGAEGPGEVRPHAGHGPALPRLRERLARDLAGDGLGATGSWPAPSGRSSSACSGWGASPTWRTTAAMASPPSARGMCAAGGGQLRFDYPAKGGQRRWWRSGPRGDRRGPGPQAPAPGRARAAGLQGRRGRWHDVRSSDINAYLQEALGSDFSAKDFRTWAATVLAAVALAEEAEVRRAVHRRRRAVVRVVKGVAEQLGNTPAARGSYVDPRVIEEFNFVRPWARTWRSRSTTTPPSTAWTPRC